MQFVQNPYLTMDRAYGISEGGLATVLVQWFGDDRFSTFYASTNEI